LLPPVDNPTDFVAFPQVLADRDGEKLVTMVKATFDLSAKGSLEIAEKKRARGIRPIDIPWGLPGETSSMFPGDFCVRKPSTDVVVVARAYAPGGKPRDHFDVSVRVGPLTKMLRVFGLRVWQAKGTGLSAPRPIGDLDLRWEYAWGGLSSDDTGHVAEEPRNPIGRGVALDPAALTHQAAPQIDDPFNPLRSIETRPQPAGVGPVMVHWEPRRSLHGTYDEAWLDDRAPLLPLDHDDRANQVATPDLVAKTPLRGGEEVALVGLRPGGGSLAYSLPRVAVEIETRVKGREPFVARPILDTVVIDQLFGESPGMSRVEMVWRSAVPAPKRLDEARVVVREVAI
jgi:hypothetical protein